MFTVIARWSIKQGCEIDARAALQELAKQVQSQESDTLAYLVHAPDMAELSLPTPSPLEVVFIEVYKDKNAFVKHVTGVVFQQFVVTHRGLFLGTSVTDTEGKVVESPFVMVENLERLGGFVRDAACGG